MSQRTRATHAKPEQASDSPHRWVRAVAAAPERIVLVGVALALAAGAAVSIGQFEPWLVLPIAAILTIVGWSASQPRQLDVRTALGSAFGLLGAAVWILRNLPWAAEFFVVRRDPGFLTLSGLWLVDHGSTDMPMLGAVDAAATHSFATADAGEAWNRNGDTIQPQGAKMLPAVIAMGGWLAGTTGVLNANIVVGALGLLAVYVLARKLMGPIAALVPALAIALSVSHMWTSRSPYSEPLTMLLIIAAVAWAWRAVSQRDPYALALAAVASGATTLVRIDGATFAIGLAMGVVVALVFTTGGSYSWRTVAPVGFLIVQATVVSGGRASLERWSALYVARLGDQSAALGAGYISVVVVLLLLVVTATIARQRWRTTLAASARARWVRAARKHAPKFGAGAIIAIWAVLASRPKWITIYGFPDGDFHRDYIAFLQRADGLEVDPGRSYDESTVTWISYYFGWPLIVLGVLGFAIMAWKLLRGRSIWAVPLAALLAPGLLYLLKPQIVPDQVWAIRRLAPSIMVGLVIAAAVAWQAAMRKLRRAKTEEFTHATSIAIAALIALSPLVGWLSIRPGTDDPVLLTSAMWVKEQDGARDQITQLCSYTRNRPVVLAGTGSHFGTVRAACDSPVVLFHLTGNPSLGRQLTAPVLRDIATAWGENPVLLTRNPEQIPWTSPPAGPTFESVMFYASGSLGALPRGRAEKNYNWYVGEVLPDGTVAFISGGAD